MPVAGQTQQLPLPPLQLRTFMGTSSNAAHPEVRVIVPDDYLLVSGGCRDNWSGWGNLLVASYPELDREDVIAAVEYAAEVVDEVQVIAH